MYAIVAGVLYIVFVALGGYFSCIWFGRDVGRWVIVGALGLAYLALKVYTDRLEKDLFEDISHMPKDWQDDFFEEAERNGLVKRKDEST